MECFCNRGTSGIEGTLSTAVGAAYSNPTEDVFCILGDTSFFYDSNALLNPQLPKNLKIIVINFHFFYLTMFLINWILIEFRNY